MFVVNTTLLELHMKADHLGIRLEEVKKREDE
jgi:hypothetical protein